MSTANGTGRNGKTCGDLGRRAAHRRAELGLSVEEVAERAMMAPGYVSYLEQHPPNLTRRGLDRLARALETTPEALLGADTNTPPGRGSAFLREPSLNRLDTEECIDLIRPGGVGRIAFAAPDGPEVLPVNFAWLDGDIILRTAHEGPIAKELPHRVSFQVDRLDGVMSQGWSVLVKGKARLVQDPAEVDDLASLSVHPWAGAGREAYVVVTPDIIAGRRVNAGSLPA